MTRPDAFPSKQMYDELQRAIARSSAIRTEIAACRARSKMVAIEEMRQDLCRLHVQWSEAYRDFVVAYYRFEAWYGSVVTRTRDPGIVAARTSDAASVDTRMFGAGSAGTGASAAERASTNKLIEQRHLNEATRHIAASEARIDDQRRIVERLKARGHDATIAEKMLDAMLKARVIFERHRDMIVWTLAEQS